MSAEHWTIPSINADETVILWPDGQVTKVKRPEPVLCENEACTRQIDPRRYRIVAGDTGTRWLNLRLCDPCADAYQAGWRNCSTEGL